MTQCTCPDFNSFGHEPVCQMLAELAQQREESAPETKAFMTLIDDSEIDLGMVEAKLGDMERERDEARDTAQMLTRNAVLAEERWNQTFEKRCAREHEMIDEAIDGFLDGVLAILGAAGMPTDDCDGDEPPETILAGWILANWMDASHRVKELEQDKCGLAADALNARQLLREFMAYVKCGQVPEDAHCARMAKRLLASDLLDARAHEGGGGGGFVDLPTAEEKYNDASSATR